MPRLRPSSLLLLSALAAVAVVIAACGGGGSSDKKETPAAATKTDSSTATGGNKSTPLAGKTPEATKASGGSTSSGGNDELKAIAKKFSESTFDASYTVTGGSAETALNGQMKLIKDGKDKFRFDVSTKQDGQDVEIIFIETKELSAFCLKNSGELGALLGIADGDGVCFKSDSTSENPVGSLADSLKDFENADVTLLEKSKKTVAGQEGSCYKTKDNQTDEIQTSCFNKDGVVLYVQTEGADPSTLEATAVSKSVSSSAFDAPYEVKDAPGFLGGSDTP